MQHKVKVDVLQLKGKVMLIRLAPTFRANTLCNALNISHFKTIGKVKMRNFNIFNAEGVFADFAGEMQMMMNVATAARVAKAVFAKTRTIVNFVNYMMFRIGKKS